MNDEERPLIVTMTQRLAYCQREAAAQLGVSASHFRRHIRDELPMPKYSGGRLLFRHRDLERWLEKR